MFSFLQRRVTCPYCLSMTPAEKKVEPCQTCKRPLPIQYIEGFIEHPPFFVQVFGWSQVGKTVYLQALTLMLVKMANVWSRYSYAAMNDTSQQKVSQITEFLSKGVMPPSTQLGEQDVYMMSLHDMERWGGRTLVSRDCAGEIFETMDIPIDQAPYLLNATTTFMMIGPQDDVSNTGGRSYDQLLNNYINTLISKGVKFNREQRKLVVVFTKADQIRDLPSDLRAYLINDPLWAAVNARGKGANLDAKAMEHYILNMAHISDRIREWVEQDAVGKNFMRLAEHRNIDLRFSLVSATGEAVVDGNRLATGLSPRRVLDPYFWALEIEPSNHNY